MSFDTSIFILAANKTETTSFVDFLPLVASLIAVAGALTVAAWNQYQDRRDRRRDLYSQAYKAVMAWAEMPYRVRRRDPNKPYDLVEQFHALQETIDYHDGWLSIESPELARAYCEFVRNVKSKTAPAIQRVWAADACDPHQAFTPPNGDDNPDIGPEKRRFLADVNDHLSLSLDRRDALKQRYPEPQRSTT